MIQLRTRWKRCALALVACMGGIALQAAPAAPLDADKLALLSCVPKVDLFSGASNAVEWLNQTGTVLPNDGGLRLSGPLKLGKACLKNVTVMGSFGVLIVQGEICNERLGDFTDALSAIGIVVGKVADEKVPEAVLGRVNDKERYVITKGLIDMRTGKTLPTSGYAFLCGAAGSGPQ